MNTTHVTTSAPVFGITRILGILVAVVLAAAAGIATGTAIQELTAPQTRTAQAAFSLSAIADLQALRGDPGAAAYVDFGVRHMPAPKVYTDYGVRHPAVSAGAAEGMTDTFRLTGPSQVTIQGAIGVPDRGWSSDPKLD